MCSVCVCTCCFASLCAHCWGFLLLLETIMFESATFPSSLILFCKGEERLFTTCRETWPREELLGVRAGTDSKLLLGGASIPSHSGLPSPVLLLLQSDSSSTVSVLVVILPKHRHCPVQSMRGVSLNTKRCTWIWNSYFGQMSAGAAFCSTVSTAWGSRLW